MFSPICKISAVHICVLTTIGPRFTTPCTQFDVQAEMSASGATIQLGLAMSMQKLSVAVCARSVTASISPQQQARETNDVVQGQHTQHHVMSGLASERCVAQLESEAILFGITHVRFQSSECSPVRLSYSSQCFKSAFCKHV